MVLHAAEAALEEVVIVAEGVQEEGELRAEVVAEVLVPAEPREGRESSSYVLGVHEKARMGSDSQLTRRPLRNLTDMRVCSSHVERKTSSSRRT